MEYLIVEGSNGQIKELGRTDDFDKAYRIMESALRDAMPISHEQFKNGDGRGLIWNIFESFAWYKGPVGSGTTLLIQTKIDFVLFKYTVGDNFLPDRLELVDSFNNIEDAMDCIDAEIEGVESSGLLTEDDLVHGLDYGNHNVCYNGKSYFTDYSLGPFTWRLFI